MNCNLEKLNTIGFFDIKPGLDRINKVLNYLDSPQDKIKSVLIAGTNGKGSVASILSSILISNGYKTALYTSPHLVSVTERIKINDREINEEMLDFSLGVVFKACEETDTSLSYFELVTAASFVYFRNENIDIAVLEVGMGGRWDATNVVTPLISVITNISFDHSEHLGNTLELIAAEKAEIIKNAIPVVSGVTGHVINVIKEKTESTNSDLYILEKDFKVNLNEDKTFNYSGINNNLNNLTTNLEGRHQINNSSLALASAELLNTLYGYRIDYENINKPLLSVDYEGRFEIIRTGPYLILDAAHNTASAKALVSSINELKEDKFIFFISMLSDKDQEGFISTISEIAEKILITGIPNKRSAETNMLFDISKKYLDDVEIIEDYKDAYEYVKKLNTPVCITGSVYLIGLIKEMIKKDPELNPG